MLFGGVLVAGLLVGGVVEPLWTRLAVVTSGVPVVFIQSQLDRAVFQNVPDTQEYE